MGSAVEPLMEETSPQTPARPEGDHIEDPAFIACLLRRAAAQRSLVTVTLPSGGRYLSAILEVDLEGGHLLLDGLTPPEGHRQLLQHPELTIHARLRGVEASFQAKIEQFLSDERGPLYRLPLPRRLRYRQRRNHHRVPVPRTLELPVTWRLEEGGEPIQGRLCDLSRAGAGIEVDEAAVPAEVRTGTRLRDCTLALPGGDRIRAEAEVRFVGRPDPAGRVRMGVRLAALDPRDRRRLERAVAWLEREYARRCPRGER